MIVWIAFAGAGIAARLGFWLTDRWDAKRKRRPRTTVEKWAVLATGGARKWTGK